MPTMPASIQTAAYADTEILFDWYKVADFKGSNIDSIKVIVKGTNGAAQTMVGIDLFFATSEIATSEDDARLFHQNVSVNQTPTTLGTTGAAVDTPGWFNNLVGYVPIAAGDFNDADLIYLNIANKDLSGMEIPVSGDLYVAAVSKGALDFRGTVVCDGVQAITQSTLTVKTTSALINFAPGDVLHDEDDRLIGMVKTVNSATEMTMTTNLVNATVDGKDLYDLSPIQLILSGDK